MKQVAAASGASSSKVKLLKMQPESSYSDYYKYMAINDYFPNFEVVARSSCTKQLHEACADTTVQSPKIVIADRSAPF